MFLARCYAEIVCSRQLLFLTFLRMHLQQMNTSSVHILVVKQMAQKHEYNLKEILKKQSSVLCIFEIVRLKQQTT